VSGRKILFFIPISKISQTRARSTEPRSTQRSRYAYEGLRQHQSLSVSTTVPSAEQISTVTSPAIKSLLALVPAANLVGTGNPADPGSFNLFSGGVLANVSLNQGSGDIDFELSQKDSMHGYYVVQKDLREEPTAGGTIAANMPGFGDTRAGFRQLLTWHDTG
jgi:hypothetical protein